MRGLDTNIENAQQSPPLSDSENFTVVIEREMKSPTLTPASHCSKSLRFLVHGIPIICIDLC